MDEENIDGYVSKDNIYRLIATQFLFDPTLTDHERELIVKIGIAIKDMPNEIDQ
jgi:hypothetical protein